MKTAQYNIPIPSGKRFIIYEASMSKLLNHDDLI